MNKAKVRVYGRVCQETGEFENFSETRSVIGDTHTALLVEVEKLKPDMKEDPIDVLKEINNLGKIPASLRKRVQKLINEDDV